ncbi:cation diffusion facilitator family transporter [Aerococcaceae bacterium NML171108]|nr:cation diffusion facilitator family transporter [Aerococcaceae bacterium NML171108]
MAHVHSHTHAHHEGSSITTAFWLNFIFALIEIVGGLIFNSTAILSDAVHDLGDAIVLLMSVVLERQSNASATPKYSYGKKRLSLVGAMINSAILLSGTVFIFAKAVQGLLNPEPVSAGGMFWLALLGIGANGLSIVKLYGKQNILERSVFVHLLEDLLGWIAVFVVSIVIYFTNWYRLDAVIALVIGSVVLSNIIRNLMRIYDMLMQASPDTKRQAELQQKLRALADVAQIHDMHWWTLDGEHHVFTAKISPKPTADIRAVRDSINRILEEYTIVDSTIEFI